MTLGPQCPVTGGVPEGLPLQGRRHPAWTAAGMHQIVKPHIPGSSHTLTIPVKTLLTENDSQLGCALAYLVRLSWAATFPGCTLASWAAAERQPSSLVQVKAHQWGQSVHLTTQLVGVQSSTINWPCP